MPRILALDTTSEFGSLALIEGGAVVEEVLLHSADGFGHVLYGQLEALLRKHGWDVAGVDCFAASSGPGSFTGVRVGLAAVEGLAEAAGKPAIGVSNLLVLASFGTAPMRATVLDARRGEVYGALYDTELHPLSGEVVAKFPVWLGSLPAGELEFISTNFTPFRPALNGTRFADCRVTDVPRALAGAVGTIAARRLAEGRVMDPAQIDANYVRRADAELSWRDPVG